MRFIIYGAGAIGGGIGGLLHHHGHDVVLIARGAHLEAMQRTGLTVRTPAEVVTTAVSAVRHPSEIAFQPDDVVLLTMKSQDTAAALDDLAACTDLDIPVVCGQNGVANERMALRRFPRVYGMLVIMPAQLLEPGHVLVRAAPVAGILDAGRYPQGIDSPIEQVTAALTASGFSAQPDPDVMRMKYRKLLTNLSNAVYALCPRSEASDGIVRALEAEARACYERGGIEFAADDAYAQRRRESLTLGKIEGYPRGGSSSWQSLARATGAIEADYLNGEIVLLGGLHGVPTPGNRAVQALANRAARERWVPESYSVEALVGAIDTQRAAETAPPAQA